MRAAALEAGLDPDFVAHQFATGWAYVDATPAAYLLSYGYDAPTFGDTTGQTTPIADFQVIAHAADPFVFWTSEPASGTSMDNLAPDAPISRVAAESSGEVELVWNDGATHVEDVSHYRISRDRDGLPRGPDEPSRDVARQDVRRSNPGQLQRLLSSERGGRAWQREWSLQRGQRHGRDGGPRRPGGRLDADAARAAIQPDVGVVAL